MTATVTDLRTYKAHRIAYAKLERIWELADELAAVAPEHLPDVIEEYVANGWANLAEIQMALKELEEA